VCVAYVTSFDHPFYEVAPATMFSYLQNHNLKDTPMVIRRNYYLFIA